VSGDPDALKALEFAPAGQLAAARIVKILI